MFKLKDNHSTVEKFQKLNEFMEDLGLYIEFCGTYTYIEDSDYPGISFNLEDLDSSDGITGLPISFETKITFDDSNKEWHDMIFKNRKKKIKKSISVPNLESSSQDSAGISFDFNKLSDTQT